MWSMEVSQSEAFLVGLAFGETQSVSGAILNNEFCSVLTQRLVAFVPDMRVSREVRLDELPPDAKPRGDGEFYSSEYHSIHETEEGLVAHYIDDSRRSLIDLVVGAVEREIDSRQIKQGDLAVPHFEDPATVGRHVSQDLVH